jgi:hypothetical protein
VLAPGRTVASPSGLKLGFSLFGSGASQAERDAPAPATISFVGHFTSYIRNKPEPEQVPLGELAGTVLLTGSPLAVVFTCDADSLTKLTEEPPDEEQADADSGSDSDPNAHPPFRPRSIELSLGAAFKGTEPAKQQRARLFLPKHAGKYRYLEIHAKLTINGNTEADFPHNDILDVLIEPHVALAYPFSL